MNRQQKESMVQLLKDQFSNSKASFLVNYQGLNVSQLQKLRQQLREKGGALQVTKARLMKLAMDDDALLLPYLKDQIGIVFASDEPPAVAKVLNEFAKQHDALNVLVGYYDESLLAKEDVVRFASLPSKEVLLAQLCGTLQAPMAGLASVLNQLIVRLAVVLKAIEKKKSE